MYKKVVALVAILVLPNIGHTIPSFARQMGLSCVTCHISSGFPELNSFGRQFKNSGYTQVGSEQTITEPGDLLSLPSTPNLSFVLKFRVRKQSDTDVNLNFPDEWVLFAGGRVGSHMGYIVEGAAQGLSIRLPIIFQSNQVTYGIVPFTTDGLGAAFSNEILNTGAVENIRAVEHGDETSAQIYLGTNSEATGLGVYAMHPLGGIVAALWGPLWGPDLADYTIKSFAQYLRVVVFPPIAKGVDIGLGLQYWGGKAQLTGQPEVKPTAFAGDAQILTSLGNKPLNLFFTYAQADTSSMFNAGGTETKSAFTLTGELGIIPNRMAVILGYRGAKDGQGNDDPAITTGAKFFLHRNVQLQLVGSFYSNKDIHPEKYLYTLMLFAGM